MARINYENESWWLRQWKNSNVAKNIANNFVNKLKTDITYKHSSNDNVKDNVSFYYENKNKHEIFITLSLFKENGVIILSEDIGKMLNIIPVQRPYKQVYLIEYDNFDMMAQKVDEISEFILNLSNEITNHINKTNFISFHNKVDYDEIPLKSGKTWTFMYNLTKYLENDKNNKIAKKLELKLDNNFISYKGIKLFEITKNEPEIETKERLEGRGSTLIKTKVLLNASFNLLIEEKNFEEIYLNLLKDITNETFKQEDKEIKCDKIEVSHMENYPTIKYIMEDRSYYEMNKVWKIFDKSNAYEYLDYPKHLDYPPEEFMYSEFYDTYENGSSLNEHDEFYLEQHLEEQKKNKLKENFYKQDIDWVNDKNRKYGEEISLIRKKIYNDDIEWLKDFTNSNYKTHGCFEKRKKLNTGFRRGDYLPFTNSDEIFNIIAEWVFQEFKEGYDYQISFSEEQNEKKEKWIQFLIDKDYNFTKTDIDFIDRNSMNLGSSLLSNLIRSDLNKGLQYYCKNLTLKDVKLLKEQKGFENEIYSSIKYFQSSLTPETIKLLSKSLQLNKEESAFLLMNCKTKDIGLKDIEKEYKNVNIDEIPFKNFNNISLKDNYVFKEMEKHIKTKEELENLLNELFGKKNIEFHHIHKSFFINQNFNDSNSTIKSTAIADFKNKTNIYDSNFKKAMEYHKIISEDILYKIDTSINNISEKELLKRCENAKSLSDFDRYYQRIDKTKLNDLEKSKIKKMLENFKNQLNNEINYLNM